MEIDCSGLIYYLRKHHGFLCDGCAHALWVDDTHLRCGNPTASGIGGSHRVWILDKWWSNMVRFRSYGCTRFHRLN